MAKEGEKILRWFLTAMEMEDKGRGFYLKVAKETRDDLAKKVFKMLAEDELVHKQRFQKIFSSIKEGKGWKEDWQKIRIAHSEPTKLFKEWAKKQGKNLKAEATEKQAISAGIGLEERSIAFYSERLSEAREEAEKKFLEQLVIEERTHHQILTDYKFYLEDPGAWFTEKEKPGLDGG